MRNIKRPQTKVAPISGKRGLDIIQILPVTNSKKAVLIELDIPALGTQYRLLELHIRDENVYEKCEELLKTSGISTQKLYLIEKGQPFNFGEYARDVAMYLFVANHAIISKLPNLDIQVPYRIKEMSFNELLELRKNSKLENSSLMNLESMKLKKYFI